MGGGHAFRRGAGEGGACEAVCTTVGVVACPLLRFSRSVNMHADVDIPIVNDHILKTKEARLINNLLEPIKILKRQNRGREDFFARRGEKNSPRGAEGAEQGPPPPALTSITLM